MPLEESDILISLIDVLKIHQRVIEYDKEENPEDYTPAILFLTTLELMVEYMIKESNTVFQNATIIVYTIVTRHPFFNGNKRTGYEAMNLVIEDGGYKLTSTKEETKDFLVRIATPENGMKPSEIEEWIINHTTKQ